MTVVQGSSALAQGVPIFESRGALRNKRAQRFAMTLSDRATLTRLLKVFDMDANVNEERSFFLALVAIDQNLNLLDNAS